MMVGDIFTTALALKDSYGASDAIVEAQRNALASEGQGNPDEAAWWRRIEEALKELAQSTPTG
jgi:hypothetical protein